MRHAVIVGIAYATLLAAAGLSTMAASLPSNIVWERRQLPAVRAQLNKIAGQDFAFFTRSPETDQIDVYRVGPDHAIGASLLVTPQASIANLFGLSRTQRAQGPELAILLRAVPTPAWVDCADVDRAACIDELRRHRPALLHNGSPIPTVCGQVALTIEDTTKWAYRRLTDARYSIERAALLSVDCGHGH